LLLFSRWRGKQDDEEINAALQALADNGIKGSEAGTQLKEFVDACHEKDSNSFAERSIEDKEMFIKTLKSWGWISDE